MPRDCSGVAPTLPLRLALPLPPSTNRIWRQFRGRTVLSAEGRQYRADVAAALAAQLGDYEALTCGLRLRAEVHMERRGCDADNRCKSLQDALQAAGLLVDDVQVCSVTVERYLDAAAPRVVLYLTEERRTERLDAWKKQPRAARTTPAPTIERRQLPKAA